MSRLAVPVPLSPRAEWERLTTEHQDVLVIGGGIQGAGAARASALRGLRTAIIERDDWAAGTSSRSSKLLHGGLRYLKQGSFGRVRESLRERDLHLRLAPGSVRSLRFRVAEPPPGTTPLWQVRAGIALYGLLSGKLGEVRWRGQPVYTDATVNDARFVLEVVMDARRHGALAMNYVEWLSWVRRGDRIVAARIRDRLTGREGWVSADVFVNAAGPWAELLVPGAEEKPLLRTTRGTHVILDRQADEDARLFFSTLDGRVLFLIPFEEGTTLLGTTDLDDPSVVKDPVPEAEEIRYLQDSFVRQFPRWSHWKPVGVMCGLRPLVAASGAPSQLSREEKLLADPSRSLLTLLGGKYTTYRATAERALDQAEEFLGRRPEPCPTLTVPIPALCAPSRAAEQIRHAFAEEDAVRLEDVFLRRTSLGYRGRAERGLIDLAAKSWRMRWGMGEKESEEEVENFLSLQGRRLAPLAAWRT